MNSKSIIYILVILSFVMIGGCNKNNQPNPKYTIEGNVRFFDKNGLEIDSSFTAIVSLFNPGSITDSVRMVQSDYPFVGPQINPILYSDYRLCGNLVATCETDQYGNFTLSNLLEGEYLLIYSSNGFGWHQRVCNIPSSENSYELNMRKKITVSGAMSDNDVVWGPDEFVEINDDIYITQVSNVQILENTVIVLQNADFIVYGTINISGNEFSPVIFTSSSENPSKGDWGRLEINNEATSEISCLILQWASFGIVNHSNISSSDIAILNASSDGYVFELSRGNVTNSLFYNCQYGMNLDQTEDEDIDIKRSIFMKSQEYGMRLRGSSPNISNSIFYNNPSHVYCKNIEGTTVGSSPEIINCLFYKSLSNAIEAYAFCSSNVSKSIFVDNYNDIICTRAYGFSVKNNNFLSTPGFVIKLLYHSGSNGVINAQRNWWNTTNEEKIQELIYDENDEPGGDDVGTVDYDNWKYSKISDAGPQP